MTAVMITALTSTQTFAMPSPSISGRRTFPDRLPRQTGEYSSGSLKPHFAVSRGRCRTALKPRSHKGDDSSRTLLTRCMLAGRRRCTTDNARRIARRDGHDKLRPTAEAFNSAVLLYRDAVTACRQGLEIRRAVHNSPTLLHIRIRRQ